MQRTSFVIDMISSSQDEPVSSDELFDVIYERFPDVYASVRKLTPEEYKVIGEPEQVD